MARIVVIGNLGSDAQVKELDDKCVINFNVAENVKKLNRETGEERTKTEWYQCSYFVKNTAIAEYLKKGKRFAVFGKLETERYKSDEGNINVSLKILVDSVEFAHTDKDGE